MVIKINMVGLLKEKIMNFITAFDLQGVDIRFTEKHYETAVDISADDGETVDNIIREIFTEFKPYIYGTNEENIYKAAFELLSFKNLKLATAESISGGRLCSEFIANNNGASKVLYEGIVCYSIDSKINRLGLKREFFDSYSPQSVECSYELASGLLMTSNADVVIATTGYAGNVDDDLDGKCYIAVGDKEFIHVFKHSFSGTRNHIIQQVSKYAFLHLIKKLRENDFDFVENVI